MAGHQVPATVFAILSLAEWGLLERRDVLGAGFDLHGLCFPQAEGVDRTSRPRTTGAAMTVTHRLRRPGDLKFNSAAKASSNVSHGIHLSCDQVGSIMPPLVARRKAT